MIGAASLIMHHRHQILDARLNGFPVYATAGAAGWTCAPASAADRDPAGAERADRERHRDPPCRSGLAPVGCRAPGSATKPASLGTW
jgi:hypothetical protein